jgi:hypothetical protein
MSNLKDVWALLKGEGQGVAGQPLSLWSGGLVVATLAGSKTPQLVIQLKEGHSPDVAAQAHRLLKVNGLSSSVENLRLNNNDAVCFVIGPSIPKFESIFYALADYLVNAIKLPKVLDPSAKSIEQIVQEWMEFFRKPSEQTNREKILGLIGELVAIRDWIDPFGLDGTAWTGPLGQPQDFRGKNDSIEVKVLGTRTGPTVHKISSLHQLVNPGDGKLYVLSMRVTLSATGASSIHDLVRDVSKSSIFADQSSQANFWDSVQGLGYSEDLEAQFSHFDLIAASLYEVRAGFPRLGPEITNADSRIFDVVYSLDFSALGEYLIHSEPTKVVLN